MENSLDKSLFVKATDEEKASAEVKRESVTYWNRVALVSIIVIAIIAILSIIIPMISEYGYAQINRGVENSLPTLEHPFGTDTLGRDLLVRCMIGARISLLIGIVSATLVVIIGIVYGSISGYFGGLTDSIMMRIVDIM